MDAEEYAHAYQDGVCSTKKFLVSKGATLDEAEDISQAAWCRGWEHRSQLRDPYYVTTWVNSIARNLFISRYRKLGSKLDPLDFEQEIRTVGTDAHHAKIQLERIVALCPPRERKLLLLQLEGFCLKDTDSDPVDGKLRLQFLRARRAARKIFERNAFIRQNKVQASSP